MNAHVLVYMLILLYSTLQNPFGMNKSMKNVWSHDSVKRKFPSWDVKNPSVLKLLWRDGLNRYNILKRLCRSLGKILLLPREWVWRHFLTAVLENFLLIWSTEQWRLGSNASVTPLEMKPQVWRYCFPDVFLLKVNEIVTSWMTNNFSSLSILLEQ